MNRRSVLLSNRPRAAVNAARNGFRDEMLVETRLGSFSVPSECRKAVQAVDSIGRFKDRVENADARQKIERRLRQLRRAISTL